MELRNLGHSDIKVSKICLGTMTFGEQNTEQDAHDQLDYAFANGVNFIDTAELYAIPIKKETYTLTEQYIGTWLKNQKRENVILASKIAGPSANISWIRNPLNFSNESIDVALEGSLKRLKTDYLDLYQLHWPERNTPRFGIRGINDIGNWENNLKQIVTKMDSLVKSGKIRTWGLSNETPWGTMRILQICEVHNLIKPVSIQNAYSLMNRVYEYGMAEVSLRENIQLLAYSPLAMGLLTGKYHLNKDKASDRMNQFNWYVGRYTGEHRFNIARKYVDLALKYNYTPTQMALSFVNERSYLSSNIIGATDLVQLKENIDSANIKISDECMLEIDKIHQLYPNPCP